eukprot:Skav208820  [mRNA]  locus=scaffold667:154263:157452:+ [translate_table: standard]
MFPEIAQFVSKCQSEAEGGRVFGLAMLDCCVWPANSAYLQACIAAFNSLLAVSPNNAGHVQLPIPQAQTHPQAVVKHRRGLEDSLVSQGLDIMRQVSLTFDKSSLPAGDKREPWHPCLFVTSMSAPENSWSDSAAAQNRSIGPCPLIRVADMLGFDGESRPGAAQRTEQPLVLKGVPAHLEVISAYLRGIQFKDEDVVVVVDILPNRQAEFSRAVLGRLLDANARRPVVKYCGQFRADQKDVVMSLEEMVYTHWDGSSIAPPRARPVEALPDPNLELLCWNNGVASFPQQILQKFGEGTAAFVQVADMKKRLIAAFPESDSAPSGASTGTGTVNRSSVRRAVGRPDFNIEGGKRPLDFTREIDMLHTPASSFTVERTSVNGMGEHELSGICFRFQDDLVLVSDEKRLISLCEFARKCCTVHGVACFELANHQLDQKMYPPVP